MESKEPAVKEKVEKKKTKESTRRNKPRDNSAITKENPGRIKNRPVSHLKKDDFYKIQIRLLEIDKANLEVSNLMRQIDNNEITNKILRLKVSEKKAFVQSIKNEYQKFLDDLKNRTGIDVRGKTLDFITGEVVDDETI